MGKCHPLSLLARTGCVIKSVLSPTLLSLRINKQELLRPTLSSKVSLSASTTHLNAHMERAKWLDYKPHLNMLPRKLTYLLWNLQPTLLHIQGQITINCFPSLARRPILFPPFLNIKSKVRKKTWRCCLWNDNRPARSD